MPTSQRAGSSAQVHGVRPAVDLDLRLPVDVDLEVLAGDRFQDSSGGAFVEGYPNDGVVSVASVLRFVELCGDSVLVEAGLLPLTHPSWNWGESLLNSRLSSRWVLERVSSERRPSSLR